MGEWLDRAVRPWAAARATLATSEAEKAERAARAALRASVQADWGFAGRAVGIGASRKMGWGRLSLALILPEGTS